MRLTRVLPSVALLAALLTAPCGAGAQAPSPPALDPSVRRAVLDSVAAEIARLYVDADTGRMIAEHLRARARAGAYDSVTDSRALPDAVTPDLRAVNGDRHLYLAYSPGTPFDRPGAGGIVDDTGAARPNTPREAERARRDHWRLGRVDVLPGNVGYMKVGGFEGSPDALAATSAALRYLEGTDAMIFDFRGMGGGSGEQSNFLISHFVGADTVPSLVVSNRSSGQRRTRYTLASVPGTRRPTVPIWILVDRGTASAGEDFAFVLRHMGRARLVGERTAGAGHNNDFVDVGHGFGVSISYTRVSDPRTGAEWERVGVLPDVTTAPEGALAVAHVAALDSLARLAPDGPDRRNLLTTRDVVLAREHPHPVPAATLASYAGSYDGGRIISVDGGTLRYQRDATRAPREMVALNDSTFALEDLVVTFDRGPDGGWRLVQHLADGRLVPLRRAGATPSR